MRLFIFCQMDATENRKGNYSAQNQKKKEKKINNKKEKREYVEEEKKKKGTRTD